MSRLPAILLAPVVLTQAAALKRATPLIDPPPEPWSGTAGSGEPTRRILALGDSTAIGTGTADAAQSLAARVAARLAERDGSTVSWRAIGHNGDTAAEVRRDFLTAARADPADDVIVLVGWNDAMRLVAPDAFARELEALLLDAGFRPVLVLPPRFERYTVMPQPLRFALGASATGIRAAAERVALRIGIPSLEGFDGSSVAPADGFHPDAAAYDRLAASVVGRLP